MYVRKEYRFMQTLMKFSIGNKINGFSGFEQTCQDLN